MENLRKAFLEYSRIYESLAERVFSVSRWVESFSRMPRDDCHADSFREQFSQKMQGVAELLNEIHVSGHPDFEIALMAGNASHLGQFACSESDSDRGLFYSTFHELTWKLAVEFSSFPPGETCSDAVVLRRRAEKLAKDSSSYSSRLAVGVLNEQVRALVWIDRDLIVPQPYPMEKSRAVVEESDATTAADSTVRADNQEKVSPIAYPENQDVRDLCCELAKKADGVSNNRIALEFTGGDKKKADSLLRQARRYRHLWERGHNA